MTWQLMLTAAMCANAGAMVMLMALRPSVALGIKAAVCVVLSVGAVCLDIRHMRGWVGR